MNWRGRLRPPGKGRFGRRAALLASRGDTADYQPVVSFYPTYPIVVIGDRRAQPPEVAKDALVSATADCVIVKTLAAVDGPTRVDLIDDVGSPPTGLALVFSGTLEVPEKRVDVTTAENEVLFEVPTRLPRVHTTVWANDRHAPDHLVVQIHARPDASHEVPLRTSSS